MLVGLLLIFVHVRLYNQCDDEAIGPKSGISSEALTLLFWPVESGMEADLDLLLKGIDLRHVVSVLFLTLCYVALQLGGVVLVGLQML